jgi:hypothetical protein
MKRLFKRRERSLKELQATLEFPDERIDFTQPGLWRYGSMEKHSPSSIARASIMLAIFGTVLIMAAMAVTLFIYYKST